MKIIAVFCCLLYAMWTVESDVSVEGFERGQVSFRCSHSLAMKCNKYLCKDPCKDKIHELVTVVPRGRAEAGGITLVDSGDGSFTVTFTQLQTSDSGVYWCGVQRTLWDTYEKVYLSVKDAVSQTTATPPFSSAWTYQNLSTTAAPIIHMDNSAYISKAFNWTDGSDKSISSGIVVYATAGCAVVVVIFLQLVALAICFKRWRGNSKLQRCSNFSNNNDYTKEETAEMDNVSATSSSDYCTVIPDEETPASSSSTATSLPLHVYENCKYKKKSIYVPADSQADCDVSCHIYVNMIALKLSGDYSRGNNPNKAISHVAASPLAGID